MTDYKPAGYNSLSPYLIVNGAQKMIDLLKQVFGARDLRRYDHPDGTIMHAEVQIDDSVIMIADASEAIAFPVGHRRCEIAREIFCPSVRGGCRSRRHGALQ